MSSASNGLVDRRYYRSERNGLCERVASVKHPLIVPRQPKDKECGGNKNRDNKTEERCRNEKSKKDGGSSMFKIKPVEASGRKQVGKHDGENVPQKIVAAETRDYDLLWHVLAIVLT